MSPFPSDPKDIVADRIETAGQCLADAQWSVGYLASKAELRPEWVLAMSKLQRQLAEHTALLSRLEAELAKENEDANAI